MLKYKCPACKHFGKISPGKPHETLLTAKCRECGAILFINPDTGEVDTYKSSLKDAPLMERPGSLSSEKDAPQLSIRFQRQANSRDWLAIAVFAAACLILCIAVGLFYFI
jgi:hypothetical protein